MIVTEKWIRDHSTSDKVGSWTKAQLSAIGVNDKRSGWIDRVVGTDISESQRIVFEFFSHKHNRKIDDLF